MRDERPIHGMLIAFCYNSNKYFVRPVRDCDDDGVMADQFREEHWHSEYQVVTVDQAQALSDLLTPFLAEAQEPGLDAKLTRAYQAFKKATGELSEALHEKMSADLSYWASEGYPEALSSFDEFSAEVAIWADAQVELLRREATDAES